MKKIAALTMLRSDEFFLSRWVEYYGGELGKDNLYIYFDGQDQTIPHFCEGTHTELEPRVEGKVLKADKGRIDFLNRCAEDLFTDGYDMIIGTDVDEFLMVDPSLGKRLPEFLEEVTADGRVSVSGLGIDVGQKLGKESILNENAPFLGQRRYALLSTRYSKSSVITRPVRWGSGFHRTRYHNFRIVPGLFLFHFGCIDMKRMEEKFRDSERISEGWSRHFAKRIRTIRTVSSHRVHSWDNATRLARTLQNIIRQLRSLNKPAMLGLKIVVSIPERFYGKV